MYNIYNTIIIYKIIINIFPVKNAQLFGHVIPWFYLLFIRMECRLLLRESIACRMTCTVRIPPSGWKNCRKCKSRLHGVKVRADRADLLLRGPQTRRKHFVQHLVYRSVRRVNRYETSASSCNGTTKCNDLISPSFLETSSL